MPMLRGRLESARSLPETRGRLAVLDVPVEEDAEGLVGVVVEEVEGFGGSDVGRAVGGHAAGVEGTGSEEGLCLLHRP